MKLLTRLPDRWSNAPTAIIATVVLLLLAGIGIIIQNEAAYRDLQRQETRVQAALLAASVTAALDFGDTAAAQEAVDAIRVNRLVRTVGVYERAGRLVAGYGRDGANPPPPELYFGKSSHWLTRSTSIVYCALNVAHWPLTWRFQERPTMH